MVIQSSSCEGLRELALFAGAGGGILGGALLGWQTICAVESDGHAAGVLAARQNDGTFEPFPIWDDVRTFDGHPWRGAVDVVSGGFPCQDISAAGSGAGLAGARSGLWAEFARIIGEVQPRWAFIENSPYLRARGLDVVLQDLDRLGYDAECGVFGADALAVAFGGAEVAVTHNRDRLWVVAHRRASADAAGERCTEQRWSGTATAEHAAVELCRWWEAEPALGRMANGIPCRVDRLKRIGNAQVPAVAALAWQVLSTRLLNH